MEVVFVKTCELTWPDFQVCWITLSCSEAKMQYDMQVLIALENQPTVGSFWALHLLHLVLK